MRFLRPLVCATAMLAIAAGMSHAVHAEEIPRMPQLPPALSVAADSVRPVPFSPVTVIDTDRCGRPTPPNSVYWIKQLLLNGFHINSPEVAYPAFPRLLLNIYNWGDRTFNSYDKDYVVSTGKNWKLLGKSTNWMEAMTMQFPDARVWLHTHLYADAGLSINFMAVGLSYFFNVNELLGVPTHRSSWNFDFTCSRFAVNLLWQRCSGDMTITRLGDYNNGHSVHIPFNGADFRSFFLDAYYFFNNRRYSHAAAYCYSKYQLKSAGSWLAGFCYDSKDLHLDFSKLDIPIPPESYEYLRTDYRFHYADYQLMGGYAHNWVIHPHRWTLNATSLLSMGYRHSYADSYGSQRNMVANGLRVDLAAVYNHRALFVAGSVRFRGALFYTSQFIFFNYNAAFNATVGMRF